ncbi:MAG: hypothetical protein C0518_00315 [Opitutus sp.]|nr:hypothetical protein [Opitutus sp.]
MFLPDKHFARTSRPHQVTRSRFAGLFADETASDSFWLRETATLVFPALKGTNCIVIEGSVLTPTDPTSHGTLGCRVRLDGRVVVENSAMSIGDFRFELPLASTGLASGHRIQLELLGVSGSNLLAWLGRITGLSFLQAWRRQARNRRMRIRRVLADGETLFDFGNRASPWNRAFARRFLDVGLNLVGYFRADLGIGESVRCAARAAVAVNLPTALVELRLPCKNPMTDRTFAAQLQLENPHPINIVHVDAPGMRDLEHHHGSAFFRGKYTIGYWAWELAEFPDAWVDYTDYCQEVWAPSRFAAEAIAAKVPVPVLAMPHAISFARPSGDLRARFGLPNDRFLFLFLYDLNSYSERKNPAAVLEAFRRSGLAGHGAALVIKVHNRAGNEADFARLLSVTQALPETTLLTETLSREDVYALEAACDCFVSLHRSEGFGLAIAECMYLGKPVIVTDWSATKEFVDETNGCPVRCRLIELERNHGPYAKGQTWAAADIDHAAAQMRRLVENPNLAWQLGAAARRTIEEKFSPAKVGARYRQRIEAIASW